MLQKWCRAPAVLTISADWLHYLYWSVYEMLGVKGNDNHLWMLCKRLFARKLERDNPTPKTGEPCEAEVTAQGDSFHLITGKYAYGNYVCIPDWDIGTVLSSLTYTFWNTELLRNLADWRKQKSVRWLLHSMLSRTMWTDVIQDQGVSEEKISYLLPSSFRQKTEQFADSSRKLFRDKIRKH